MSEPILLIAGGGTGGHVLAGVAVAEAWTERQGRKEGILFVGAEGGIEEKLVPRAGFPLRLLKLGSLNGVSLLRKVRTMFLIPWSLVRSASIVLQSRPEAVLGVGGYASGPLVLMAKLLGRRTAILEQNSVPGMTNRILGRLVDCVFCAFPGTEKQFPGKRVVLTGNPIRSAIRPLPPAPRDPFTVFIFGGSQGAQGINSLVLQSLPHLAALKGRLRWIHQTGERDHERVVKGYRDAGIEARVEKFIHDMPTAYSQASLLICRAGSSTLAEIAAVGRAAVLVPFPFASDNHQEKNARVFADGGAAWLLRQADAKGEDLAKLIRDSLADSSRLDKMEKAAASYYRPHAARDIVEEFLKLSGAQSSRS